MILKEEIEDATKNKFADTILEFLVGYITMHSCREFMRIFNSSKLCFFKGNYA